MGKLRLQVFLVTLKCRLQVGLVENPGGPKSLGSLAVKYNEKNLNSLHDI
jgi:hypothetical protein